MVNPHVLRLIIDQVHVPVIVDAGLGSPMDACQAMELGAAAVLVNTAIAAADDPVAMAAASASPLKLATSRRKAGIPSAPTRPLRASLRVWSEPSASSLREPDGDAIRHVQKPSELSRFVLTLAAPQPGRASANVRRLGCREAGQYSSAEGHDDIHRRRIDRLNALR